MLCAEIMGSIIRTLSMSVILCHCRFVALPVDILHHYNVSCSNSWNASQVFHPKSLSELIFPSIFSCHACLGFKTDAIEKRLTRFITVQKTAMTDNQAVNGLGIVKDGNMLKD